MAELVEELICHLAETVIGTLNIEHRNDDGAVRPTIHLQRPWRRSRYTDLIRAIDSGWFERSPEAKIAKCRVLGVEIQPEMQEFEITQQVFEKLIEEKTNDPLFVSHIPNEL